MPANPFKQDPDILNDKEPTQIRSEEEEIPVTARTDPNTSGEAEK